jgi:branched-chain amino acid transport system substrate-binding protein
MKTMLKMALLASALCCAAFPAQADITIGVDLPLTGPAAGLGIPCKKGLDFWPDSIAGEKIKLIVLDDMSDPSQATKNARRFISEDHVDVILGSAITVGALAIAPVAAEGQTVQLAESPVDLPPGKDAWTFRLPQSTALMAAGIVDHMKKNGVKTFAFIGYSDTYGESWLKDLTRLAGEAGITLTTAERFARSDTSVTAQAIKAVSTNPDAIVLVASGAGAATPHLAVVERGYKGKIYQTHSAASGDLLRLGGKSVEGAFVIAGLAIMPEGLPDSHPSKKLAVDFVQKYEKAFGPGSRNQFSAHTYDALLVLQHVVPMALKKGKPGTPEFRAALRDALENSGGIVATQGTFRYTPTDHFGLDASARMMLTIANGNWKVVTP